MSTNQLSELASQTKSVINDALYNDGHGALVTLLYRILSYCDNDETSVTYLGKNIEKSVEELNSRELKTGKTIKNTKNKNESINIKELRENIELLIKFYKRAYALKKDYNKISYDIIVNIFKNVETLDNILSDDKEKVIKNIPITIKTPMREIKFDLRDIYLCGYAMHKLAKSKLDDTQYIGVSQELFLEPKYITGNLTLLLDFLYYGFITYTRNTNRNQDVKTGFYIEPENFKPSNSKGMSFMDNLNIEEIFTNLIEDGQLKPDFLNPDGKPNISKLSEMITNMITKTQVKGNKFFDDKQESKISKILKDSIASVEAGLDVFSETLNFSTNNTNTDVTNSETS